jgi:hypothetical protein
VGGQALRRGLKRVWEVSVSAIIAKRFEFSKRCRLACHNEMKAGYQILDAVPKASLREILE